MLTRTCTILSAAIILATASAALAMSPSGSKHKPFANAYARAAHVQSIAPTLERDFQLQGRGLGE